MGLMRFAVSPPDRLTEEAVQQAYLTGIDRVSWQIRTAVDNGQLVLQRAVGDSANLHIPWPVPGRGSVVLSTGSLIEQPEPYHLPLELARGTVGQLRQQLADLELLGLAIPEGAAGRVAEAVQHLARAAVMQEDPAASGESAETAIRIALEVGDQLVGAYVEQAVASRRRAGGKLPVVLAATLGPAPLDEPSAGQFLAAFHAAVVPICWRQIEASEGRFDWTVADQQIQWCRQHGLKVYAGPLLPLDLTALPEWLCLWQGDFDSILSMSSEFVHKAVERYRGQVDAWWCASRINSADVLGLAEEERLRLAARAVELAHSADPRAALLVGFDQPWAEYMSRRELDFPPLQFADALVRAGLHLRGLVLEINVGYHPGGTLLRSAVEFSRQLDCWSVLGLPLIVGLVVPSASGDDPLAARRVRVTPDGWTPKAQQAWVARHVPLILAKPYVHAVFWNQLSDRLPHEFPHGGLLDGQGRPKPAFRTLAGIRQAYLK